MISLLLFIFHNCISTLVFCTYFGGIIFFISSCSKYNSSSCQLCIHGSIALKWNKWHCSYLLVSPPLSMSVVHLICFLHQEDSLWALYILMPLLLGVAFVLQHWHYASIVTRLPINTPFPNLDIAQFSFPVVQQLEIEGCSTDVKTDLLLPLQTQSGPICSSSASVFSSSVPWMWQLVWNNKT